MQEYVHRLFQTQEQTHEHVFVERKYHWYLKEDPNYDILLCSPPECQIWENKADVQKCHIHCVVDSSSDWRVTLVFFLVGESTNKYTLKGSWIKFGAIMLVNVNKGGTTKNF